MFISIIYAVHRGHNFMEQRPLEKLTVAQIAKKIPSLYRTGSLVPCLRGSATGHNLKSDESGPEPQAR